MSKMTFPVIPGLSSENSKKIISVFKRHVTVSRVILYGSRAKGTYKKGSDIDLALESEKISLQEMLCIEREIDDLLLPWKFDISMLFPASKSYHKTTKPADNVYRGLTESFSSSPA